MRDRAGQGRGPDAEWWGVYSGILLIAGLAMLVKGVWWGVLAVLIAIAGLMKARRAAMRGS